MTRGRGVVLAVALAAVLGGLAAPTWVSGTVWTALDDAATVAVTGGTAAPATVAGALVVAAAGVAMGLAGRIGSVVAACVVAVGGLVAAVGAVAVLVDPGAVLATAARTAVGTGEVTGSARATAAPVITLVVGVLTVLCAGWVGWASREWQVGSRRHDRPRPDPGQDDRSLWDSMSRGEDPTA